MISASKFNFLNEYYYKTYKKQISESEKIEAMNLLNAFFDNRGYKLIDVTDRGINYPVNVIFLKNGNKQVLKVPMITFEKYHLINTLGYMFDSLEKRGVFK